MAKFDTLTVHAGYTPDATGAVMPAIYATSTYAQPAPGEHTGYEYSRSANPTRTALESAIAELEGGSRGYAFASGLAACSTVLELLDQGSHLVAVDDLYGGTYRLLEKVRSRTAGLRVTYVSPADLAGLEQAIEPDTKMIWVETPTNPLLKLADLSAIATIAKKHGLISVADNTFASPYIQRPLDLGFDVVVHSATKYLNGHSDVVAGAVIAKDKDLAVELAWWANNIGVTGGAFDSYLLLRGMRTLSPRIKAAQQNAEAIVSYLQQQPLVKKLYHPSLPQNPGHEIARRQQRGFGAMLSFELDGDEALLRRFLSALELFTLAESLGGVESLISHAATMTHAGMAAEARAAAGISESLLRISVGIEAGAIEAGERE
eukprot:TRINITY_DN5361_c0_g1_i2.p1 TRINITY_DN5361_c0_g1~~TRINITY_DN5361_c0_g1_i2.p1  ORF type:complete len:376 (+),score=27.47 TRINITY_DN5361_c0_g1_i2:55-1182(+)